MARKKLVTRQKLNEAALFRKDAAGIAWAWAVKERGREAGEAGRKSRRAQALWISVSAAGWAA